MVLLNENNINYENYLVISLMSGNRCIDKIKCNVSEIHPFPKNPLNVLDIEREKGEMFVFFLSPRLLKFLDGKVK